MSQNDNDFIPKLSVVEADHCQYNHNKGPAETDLAPV